MLLSQRMAPAPTSFAYESTVTLSSSVTTVVPSSLLSTQVGNLTVINMGTDTAYLGPTTNLTTNNAPIVLPGVPAGGVVGGIYTERYGGPLYGRSASGNPNLRVFRT